MTLSDQCHAVLCDAQHYLDQLDAATYQQGVPLLSGATIGQHSRHFIEFFQCLLAQAPLGYINYDLRLRDLNIEQDPAFASEVICDMKDALAKLDSSVELRFETSGGGEVVPTNIARELIYNIEHTTHHLAIIKIGLKLVAPEMSLPESFGVAPSTLAYRKKLLCAK